MITVKVKTAELTGPALDWAAAKATGAGAVDLHKDNLGYWLTLHRYSPSTRWSCAGPLIERFEIDFNGQLRGDSIYMARCRTIGDVWFGGKTPLIAVCRAVVAANLGDEVEVPPELAEGKPHD